MDYLDAVTIIRHAAWADFDTWRIEGRHRLVLFTTSGANPISTTDSRPKTCCYSAANPAGVPPEVHQAADARLVIPMRSGMRSLNVAVAAAMAAGEALRQTGGPN